MNPRRLLSVVASLGAQDGPRGLRAEGSRWRSVVLASLAAGFGFLSLVRGEEVPYPTLTNFQQVISLGLAGAMEATYPVRVRGVVAFPTHGPRELLHIHDGTNGLGVSLLTLPGSRTPRSALPKVGELVEVEGETAAGSSHPYIVRATARVLGSGQFGEPPLIRAGELAAGRRHGDMVRLRGTILDVSRARGYGAYMIQADDYGFVATVNEPPDRLPVELLNASVELQGMPWTQFDGAGRVTSFRMLVGSNAWVRVLKPGSSNLYAGAHLTLAAVSNAPLADDRIVVSGVVSYAWPNHFVALQDSTGAAIAYLLQPLAKTSRDGDYVQRPPRPLLQPGDVIALVGSKSSRRPYSPQLNNSEYRVVRHESLPVAPLITEADALTGEHDCRRVRMIGRIVDRDWYEQFGSRVSRLWIKFGDHTTFAVLAGSNRVDFAAPSGSRVEVTGLCVVSAGTERPVRNFGLYLNAVEDARPLADPPVWLSATVLRIGGAAGGVLALILGWVSLLRRQVSRQTAALRRSNQQLEAEAVERKRVEAELLKALARERELGALKTSFVSMVSHEFRTPLEVIVSSADILDRYLDRLPPADRAEHLGAIQHSVKRMSGMMEDVLLLGRFESDRQPFRPDDVHLNALCRRLADEMRSATGGKCPLELVLDDSLPLASADENLLRHILTNLLSNAVKYSPAGSPVILRLGRDGRDAVIQVADSGVGIPAADQAHVFEAFHRGRNTGQIPGTGLGLVIVKRSVSLHGGMVEFVSGEGKGTQFTVRLPVFHEAEP